MIDGVFLLVIGGEYRNNGAMEEGGGAMLP